MKLRACYETEIYICESGYVAIKQTSVMDSNQTVFLLSPDQIFSIKDWIEDNRENIVYAWDVMSKEGPDLETHG